MQIEILRRIRLDYSLTAERVLEQLRESIPDVTAEEIDGWRKQGVLQHRIIDGEVRYFNRAAGTLFRACPAVKARCRTRVAPAGVRFDLPKHLAQLVAEAEWSGQTQIHPVKHRVRYTLRVKEGHPRLSNGAQGRCWLPFPQEYRQQVQVKPLSGEPGPAVVSPCGHPHRTVYFELQFTHSLRTDYFLLSW